MFTIIFSIVAAIFIFILAISNRRLRNKIESRDECISNLRKEKKEDAKWHTGIQRSVIGSNPYALISLVAAELDELHIKGPLIRTEITLSVIYKQAKIIKVTRWFLCNSDNLLRVIEEFTNIYFVEQTAGIDIDLTVSLPIEDSIDHKI